MLLMSILARSKIVTVLLEYTILFNLSGNIKQLSIWKGNPALYHTLLLYLILHLDIAANSVYFSWICLYCTCILLYTFQFFLWQNWHILYTCYTCAKYIVLLLSIAWWRKWIETTNVGKINFFDPFSMWENFKLYWENGY